MQGIYLSGRLRVITDEVVVDEQADLELTDGV